MNDAIEIGTISSRGQVAIPAALRARMGLVDGEKVVFVLHNDSLIIRRVASVQWDVVTEPLRRAAAESGLVPSDVEQLVRGARALDNRKKQS